MYWLLRTCDYEQFLISLRLISIGAAGFSQEGVDLFGMKTLKDDDDMNQWPSISPSPQFEQFMVFSQFEGFRRLYLAFVLMEAKGKMIPGGTFQVQWKNLTSLELVKLSRHTGLVLKLCVPGDQELLY